MAASTLHCWNWSIVSLKCSTVLRLADWWSSPSNSSSRWSPEPAFFGISGSVLSIFKLKTEIHSHQVSSNFLYSSCIMKHVAECFSQRAFLSFSPKSCSRLSFRIWWFSNMSIWSYGRVEIKQLGFEEEVDLFFLCGTLLLPSSPLDCEVRC